MWRIKNLTRFDNSGWFCISFGMPTFDETWQIAFWFFKRALAYGGVMFNVFMTPTP
jgi:hypothetical protein